MSYLLISESYKMNLQEIISNVMIILGSVSYPLKVAISIIPKIIHFKKFKKEKEELQKEIAKLEEIKENPRINVRGY